MTVKIKIYDRVKYDKASEKIAEVEYNINGFKVVCGGAEAQEIESETDGSCMDDFHEYLILDFGNGEKSTFRNSYVDMFRV
jgi:hypothetical protein